MADPGFAMVVTTPSNSQRSPFDRLNETTSKAPIQQLRQPIHFLQSSFLYVLVLFGFCFSEGFIFPSTLKHTKCSVPLLGMKNFLKCFNRAWNYGFCATMVVSETTVETAKKPMAPSLKLVVASDRCTSNTPPRHSVSESTERKNALYAGLTEYFFRMIVAFKGK